MIVSKLGVKVGNTVLYSLDKTEIELLNGAISDLVVNTNDSKSILVNVISYALSGVGLSDELVQKLHLIERLSNSVGYELDLVSDSSVSEEVSNINFNGIYVKRESDGEIVYFIPYAFYKLYADLLYSIDESTLKDFDLQELQERKAWLTRVFSRPDNGNIKTVGRGIEKDFTNIGSIYYSDYGLFDLLEKKGLNLDESKEYINSLMSGHVLDYFSIWESNSVWDFLYDERDGGETKDTFEMIFV